MEKYLDFDKKRFPELMQKNIQGPVRMLNLLKFKKHVTETDLSGKEQYDNYMKEAFPYFKKSNAKILFFGEAKFTFIGPEGEWDKVLIVEYASLDDFLKMAQAEGYPSGSRRLALEDSRLVLCG